eukprot:scaffold1778_cov246-Pinguiococcus_pyrenoidosus.AAC.12
MLPLVCNDAVAVFFMFDLTRKATLANVKEWYKQVRGLNRSAHAFLVGTKYDLYTQQLDEGARREVDKQARKYARAMKAPLVYVSASHSVNVQKLFKIVLSKVFDLRLTMAQIEEGSPRAESSSFQTSHDGQPVSTCSPPPPSSSQPTRQKHKASRELELHRGSAVRRPYLHLPLLLCERLFAGVLRGATLCRLQRQLDAVHLGLIAGLHDAELLASGHALDSTSGCLRLELAHLCGSLATLLRERLNRLLQLRAQALWKAEELVQELVAYAGDAHAVFGQILVGLRVHALVVLAEHHDLPGHRGLVSPRPGRRPSASC